MIEADSLTKRYGSRAAVQDVSFSCAAGTVTGFLGPNGAGKSTTLKMLCGLAHPSAGRCTVLGVPFDSLANPGRHVGVLIDASAAHSGRRGAETLATSARLLGVPRTRVDEMLAIVGLDGAAAHKRVGQYSLGMRQRLGIAHALLGDPEVLILDEPANGLDPEGMRWMRGLLADFAGRGGTVLLSSHLLHEVELIADRLIIISAGAIAAQGTRAELAGAGGDTRVRSVDDGALRHALEDRGVTISVAEDGALLAAAEPALVGDAALAAGVALRELGGSREGGLEQLFFRLTESGAAGEGRPGSAPPGAQLPQPHPPQPRPPRPPVPPSPSGSSREEIPMSTTSPQATPNPILIDERRPGFGRLTSVELRKTVDTRSGFWLPLGIVAITLITVVISALVNHRHDTTIVHLFHNSVQPEAFLLPVLGILLVCGEWTQRTTLTTFTLVPNRGRVLAAKLAASVALAVGAFIVCVVLSVIFGELLSNAPGGAGGISVVVLAQGLLFLAASMVMGVAFGAAILVSAPAIVAYLLLPTIWGALVSGIHSLATLDRWLDIGTTLGPLAQRSLSASDWAHAGTTIALWMALPLAIGWWRFRTRDVN